MRCGNCGRDNPEKTRYCLYCGDLLEEDIRADIFQRDGDSTVTSEVDMRPYDLDEEETDELSGGMIGGREEHAPESEPWRRPVFDEEDEDDEDEDEEGGKISFILIPLCVAFGFLIFMLIFLFVSGAFGDRTRRYGTEEGTQSTASYSSTPVPQPTAAPEATAAPTSQPTATPEATAAPTPQPTATPEVTAAPTPQPTAAPQVTETPIPQPTETPAPAPTEAPAGGEEAGWDPGEVEAEDGTTLLLPDEDTGVQNEDGGEADFEIVTQDEYHEDDVIG